MRDSLQRAKPILEDIQNLYKRLEKITQMSPKEVNDIMDELQGKQKLLNNFIRDVSHVYNFFPEFVQQYGLNMNIIIPLMNRFYTELFKPAKIEKLKKSQKLDVEYSEDVPEDANYLDTIDSGRGKDFYSVYEHDGRYLLRIKLDWGSDSGIYYLYADNKDEIMDIVNHYEFYDVLNSMKGSIYSGNDMNMVENLIKSLNKVKLHELEYLKGKTIDADSLIYDVLSELGENVFDFNFVRYEDADIFMNVYLRYRHQLLDIENRIKSL